MDRDILDFLEKYMKHMRENHPEHLAAGEIVSSHFVDNYGIALAKVCKAYEEDILAGRAITGMILLTVMLYSGNNVDDSLCELDIVHKEVREHIIKLDKSMNMGGKQWG